MAQGAESPPTPNRMRACHASATLALTVSAVLSQLAAGASIDELVAVSELSDLGARLSDCRIARERVDRR